MCSVYSSANSTTHLQFYNKNITVYVWTKANKKKKKYLNWNCFGIEIAIIQRCITMAFNGSGAAVGDGPLSKRLCTGKLAENNETGHNNNKVSKKNK